MKHLILQKLALYALLALPALPMVAQQTFTIASNLPPVFQAGAGVTEVFPQNTFVPFDLAPNTFASGGIGSYTYSWSPTLGLSSPTVPSPMVTFTNLAAQGQYVLTVMDGNGCTILDTVLVNFSTGAKDGHAWPVELVLYPNPSEGSFQLSLRGQPTPHALRMSVVDALGRVVLERQLPTFQGRATYDVDLREAGAGFYLLTLQSGAYRIQRPLIVR